MSRMEEERSPAEAAEIAGLDRQLAALAASAEEAQDFLLQLASALFPEGPPDRARVTWADRKEDGRRRVETDSPARAEARLRAAEVRYRTLVEQIPAVTFMAVLGEGENEVYVSPHIETLLGFTQKEWLENPFLWYSQLHPDDRELWNEEFARGCRTGGPFKAECRFLARDGRVVWVRGEARVVKDDMGRPLFLQGVALDITESKRAEALMLREAVRTTEERYRDLVHGLGAVVWEAEPAPFEFTLVSRQAEEMLGYAPERWLREPAFWPGRIHADDREAVTGHWRAAIREGTQHVFEYRAWAADGRLLWLQDTVRIIRDADGQARHLLGLMLDVTERKQAEEERAQLLAREQEARGESETLNRVGRLLVAELDFQRLVQTVTDAGTALCGAQFGAFFYNVEDPAGDDVYTLYTLSGAPREAFERFPQPRATKLFEPTFKGTAIVRSDDVLQDPRYGSTPPHHGLPAGHLPVRSYLAVPVKSRSGEVLGGLFFGHPEPGRFTERHERMVGGLAAQAAIAMDNARLFEAAGKARQVAEEANRAKDEFLATMSHELRTPLNSVLGWVRMLRGGQVAPDRVVHALDVVERNARAQVQLVEDILDVSRIITGKLRLEVKPVQLTFVIEAALDVVRLAAQAKDIELQVALDPAATEIHGDANRLQQVVWNLLANAVKFTPRGGRVVVRLERAESRARLVISDTGTGIAPEFLPHVFDRFRQADSSSTRAHGGLGLGLAIVRHIVEQHGGEVRVESAGLGQGATFIVEIPLSTPGQAAGDAAALALTSSGALEGVRVLVVEDEPDARELTTALLRMSGAEVTAVASAAEALSHVERAQPDVLVSDIGMPRQDGYGLVRELRARGHQLPAVALTAYGRDQDRQRAFAAGFQVHVSKPTDPGELATVILTVLGRTP